MLAELLWQKLTCEPLPESRWRLEHHHSAGCDRYLDPGHPRIAEHARPIGSHDESSEGRQLHGFAASRARDRYRMSGYYRGPCCSSCSARPLLAATSRSESTRAVSPEGLLAAIKNNNVRYLTAAARHGVGHASTAFMKWPGAPPTEMGLPFASRMLGRPLALGRRHNALRGKEERSKQRASARYAEQENNHSDSLTRRCGFRIDVLFHDH